MLFWRMLQVWQTYINVLVLWKLTEIMLHLYAGFIGLACYFVHKDSFLCIFNKLCDNNPYDFPIFYA